MVWVAPLAEEVVVAAEVVLLVDETVEVVILLDVVEVLAFEVVEEVVAFVEVELLPPTDVVVVPADANVLPMGPNLMLEYVTDDDPYCDSVDEGTPDVVAHVPRATPGVAGSAVVG